MRRRRAEPRVIAPDLKYGRADVATFINRIMQRGKKSVARRIVYGAFSLAEERGRRPALEIFDEAIKNVTPLLKVKPRRVAGATYQIPIEVHPRQALSLAMRWLIQATRARKGKPMMERLAAELLDAAKGQGAAVKRREDTHKMAEAGRAFVHYRW